jgi:hypothetical protein
MTEYAYMILADSVPTVTKRFRVIADGYDDGTLDKSQNVNKTIGGGLDASVGAIYKSWSPLVKIRHTEPVTDYGTLADLIYFYSLNNPGGAPNDRVTFTDHHGTPFTVLMLGTFKKQLLGCKIEGTEAWFIVQLNLQEIPT